MTIDDVREKNRNRQRRYRERQKSSSVTLQSETNSSEHLSDDNDIQCKSEDTPSNVTNIRCPVCNNASHKQAENLRNDSENHRDMIILTGEYKTILKFLKNPTLISGGLFILAVTTILIILQTHAYQSIGQSLALPIAMACELGLVILAAIRFTGWHRFCSVTVTLLLFFYNLGLMSFDIVLAEEIKTATFVRENFRVKSLSSDISLAQAAQKLATKKEESGNIKFHSARIAELRAELKNLTPEIANASHTQAKSWGLVALRAILMLLNTLLVHSLAEYVRKRILDKDQYRVA